MTNHHFKTRDAKGNVINIKLGWDRQQGNYCLLIEQCDPPFTLSTTHTLHSSRHDNVYDLMMKLSMLGFTCPQSMFDQVELDATLKTLNRHVRHQADGRFTE